MKTKCELKEINAEWRNYAYTYYVKKLSRSSPENGNPHVNIWKEHNTNYFPGDVE